MVHGAESRDNDKRLDDCTKGTGKPQQLVQDVICQQNFSIVPKIAATPQTSTRKPESLRRWPQRGVESRPKQKIRPFLIRHDLSKINRCLGAVNLAATMLGYDSSEFGEDTRGEIAICDGRNFFAFLAARKYFLNFHKILLIVISKERYERYERDEPINMST